MPTPDTILPDEGNAPSADVLAALEEAQHSTEPTGADIAANRVKLQELRDRVDRLTTPKAIVLSGYTVLGLANNAMVERNRKAMEEWEAARVKAADARERYDVDSPAAAVLELQDMAAAVEARLDEALHEVVKAMTMQAAADKGARAGLEKLMAQLMTDMDVLSTKARSSELKLEALRMIADEDDLAIAEARVIAALSDDELDYTPPADNDADLAKAIGDLP